MKTNVFIYLVSFLFVVEISGEFFISTMPDLIKFAQSSNTELIPDENGYVDPLTPFFDSSYIQSAGMKERFFNFFRRLVGIAPRVKWVKDEFETLLDHAYKEQVENKVHKKATTGSCECRYIVWGDLGGKVHALIDGLECLYKQKQIDENLVLAPNYYMIFTGNLIGSCAYNLELLMVIFKLMEMNPERIICIRGSEESNYLWRSHNTYRELQIKVGKDKAPLFADKLDKLFNEFYEKFIISYVDRHKMKKNILLSFKGFTDLGLVPDDTTSIQIKSNYNQFSFRQTEGLSLVCPECGVVTWTIYSAPTYVARKFYKFYNDSFVILELSKNGYDWVIHHYYKNFNKQEDEFKEDVFNFVTGQKLETSEDISHFTSQPQAYLPPITKPQIDHGDKLVFGSYLDLSGSIKNIGTDLRYGICLRFNRENIEKGGINKKPLRFVALDDRYNQTLTLEQLIRLYETYYINSLVTGLGTRPLYAAIEFSNKHDIGIFFPYSGAPGGRKEEVKNVVNLRASYRDEAYAMVDYAVNKLRKRRFAIFYQDDAYGRAGRDPAIKRLKDKYGINEILEVPHPVGSLKMDKLAEQVIKFGPSAILFFSISVAAQELVESMGIKAVMNVAMLSVSFMSHGFSDYLKSKGLSSVLSQVVPSPQGNTLIAQEFNEDIKKYIPSAKVNSDVFEGYIGASLLVEGLKTLGSSITMDKLFNYYASLKDFDFKGLKLNYNPQTRQLLHTVWLDTGAKEWEQIEVAQDEEQNQQPIS